MRAKKTPPPCTVAGCGAPAAHAFLAVTGGQADKVVDTHGKRVRTCRAHFQFVVDRLHEAFAALPGGGPARLRAVPLVAA